jgi:hypothetical protein
MKSKKTVLAVILTALTLALAAPAPAALACGGYAQMEPPEHAAIRAVMERHAERRADIARHVVTSITVEGARAEVVIRYERARDQAGREQAFTLVRRGESWRVVSRTQALAIG